MIALLFTLAAAAAPDVKYVVKIEPRSWQPIEPESLEKVIEAKSLEPLTQKGLMRLEKGKFSELAEADFSLMMEGRFIEDAGQFSVYITFTPQKRSDAPSVYVIDTDEVEDKTPQEMQKIISALVVRAAKRMATTLEPHLRASSTAAPLIDNDALPLAWGEIDVPSLNAPTGALKDLINVRNEDHVRWKAFADLKGHAFDQPAARSALELCVLRDPLPKLRADCAEALAPVARTRIETQRLLLHVLRTDVEPEVMRAVADVSKSFVGISRKEALATWMQVISDDATPDEAARSISQLLREENGLPNLELATSKCLLSQALTEQKRGACAETLLDKVKPERRAAVAWRYLETAKIYDQGAVNTYKEVLENVVGRSGPVDAALADMLLARAPRRDSMWATHEMIYIARRHSAPTAATIDSLLEVAKRRRFASSALQSIGEIVSKHPELKAPALSALKRFDGQQTYMAYQSHGDPKKDLAQLIKRMEK
ncbi:MAG: hypothetical protein IT381_27425 [Deltaproteobacteria bacterium]|nr:hypothetical protein [Deltaproteobacteria bacterium]